jgi:4-diphosphocytidyl-2-C-methyl-D-erythritol kinase
MYKERFFNPKDTDFDKNKSNELLEKYSPAQLNDLFQPALTLYPDLFKYQNHGFFTGSGSSFFKIKS